LVKVLVLGAGVVGTAAAYYLAKAGHAVRVIERQPGAGLETSFANAGHLCATTSQPWADPSVPRMVLKEWGRADAPFVMRLRADPAMWGWALRFLRHCNAADQRRITADLSRLSKYSHDALVALREAESLDYDQSRRGLLYLYRDRAGFDAAARAADALDADVRPQVMDMAACVDVEPALDASQVLYAGGLYHGDDETGDAHLFTRRLAEITETLGADFRYGVTARALRRDGDTVTGVATDHGDFDAEATVLSLGSYSPALLRPLGPRLPIYPVKGYSVTIPVAGRNGAPAMGIADRSRKIGMSRLGDRFRIAGTAELTGHDTTLNESRARAILRTAKSIFPDAGDWDDATLWTGLRPMTPDCAPVVGATPYRGLYLDTGHGSLGWTLACGSGRAIADIVSGKPAEIDLDGLTPARFLG